MARVTRRNALSTASSMTGPVGEFRSGHEPRDGDVRVTARGTPLNSRDPVDVDRALQPRADGAPAEPMYRQRRRPNPRTPCESVLTPARHRAAFHSIVSRCPRGRLRAVVLVAPVAASAPPSRRGVGAPLPARTGLAVPAAHELGVDHLVTPHRSRLGYSLRPRASGTSPARPRSIVKWAMSNPWFACAHRLASGAIRPAAAPHARTGCPPATRCRRIRRRAGDRPAAGPWPPRRHGSAPSGPRRRPRPAWSPRS